MPDLSAWAVGVHYKQEGTGLMPTKKVAIYCRVSTDSQTTENQRRVLMAYCEAHGLQVYRVYEDSGISGAQHDRPALDEMLRDAKDNRFSSICVWKIDRLARSVSHLLEILTTLRAQGIGFISTTEAINTETASGRMLLVFLGAISEFERELCRERIVSSLQRIKAEGKIRLGRPRVGFDIQRAIKLRNEGLGYKQIAKALNIPRTTLYRGLKAIPKTPVALLA